MKYSLINVHHEENNLVDGVWIQDHTGTLESAKHVANDTEVTNSYRIKVAVVGDLSYSSPDYSLRKGLKRLG